MLQKTGLREDRQALCRSRTSPRSAADWITDGCRAYGQVRYPPAGQPRWLWQPEHSCSSSLPSLHGLNSLHTVAGLAIDIRYQPGLREAYLAQHRDDNHSLHYSIVNTSQEPLYCLDYGHLWQYLYTRLAFSCLALSLRALRTSADALRGFGASKMALRSSRGICLVSTTKSQMTMMPTTSQQPVAGQTVSPVPFPVMNTADRK